MNSLEHSMNLIKQFHLSYRTLESKRWINLNKFKENIIIDKSLYDIVDKELESKSKNYKNLSTPDSNQYYIAEKHLFSVIKQLKTHPEHYNAHQIYGLKIKFHKQAEIETLAIIYKHYRSRKYMQMHAFAYIFVRFCFAKILLRSNKSLVKYICKYVLNTYVYIYF